MLVSSGCFVLCVCVFGSFGEFLSFLFSSSHPFIAPRLFCDDNDNDSAVFIMDLLKEKVGYALYPQAFA